MKRIITLYLTSKCEFSPWVFNKSDTHIYQDTNKKKFPNIFAGTWPKIHNFYLPPHPLKNHIILNSYPHSLNNFKKPSWVARNSCFSKLTMTAMVRDTVGVHCHCESRKLHFKHVYIFTPNSLPRLIFFFYQLHDYSIADN